MDYLIREMKQEEYVLLSDFLYEAIYIPEGVEPPPRSVIDFPELQEYIVDFGTRKHDRALAISVYQEYRGHGIGTALLQGLLSALKSQGYPKVSLSVQKANYAVKMYQTAGFQVVGENKEEYIMVADLCRS